MRCRSPAKIAASSPPAAARISRKTLWSSSGSGGTSRRCSVGFVRGRRALERSDLLLRERAQARVRVGGHRARRRKLALAAGEPREAARNRVDAREFHGQLAELVRAAEHRGIGEHALDLGVAVGDALEPAADRFLHGGSRPVRNRRAAASASEASPLLGGLAQRRRRRMQQPVGERRRELLEHRSGGWPAASRRRASASSCVARGLGLAAQLADHRHGIPHLEARHELGDIRVDQPARDRGLGLARLDVLVDDLPQVVDRVEIDVLERADRAGRCRAARRGRA